MPLLQGLHVVAVDDHDGGGRWEEGVGPSALIVASFAVEPGRAGGERGVANTQDGLTVRTMRR